MGNLMHVRDKRHVPDLRYTLNFPYVKGTFSVNLCQKIMFKVNFSHELRRPNRVLFLKYVNLNLRRHKLWKLLCFKFTWGLLVLSQRKSKVYVN